MLVCILCLEEILNATQILVIKLFLVFTSKMCDEHSASQLSAFNSAKHNSLSTENLIHMAQLHDHWTYGLESPMYTHSATLHLLKAQAAPKTVHLPAPSLQDLLNLASANEEPTFFCMDPYGAQALEDDAESEEEGSEPTIIMRGSQVERLEIEKLIDLANPKLLAHYKTPLQPATSTQPAKPAQAPSVATLWSDENWAADEADF